VALISVLNICGWASLKGLPLVEVDSRLATASTAYLRTLGALLAQRAPRRKAGYTRFHLFAMCVADHLEARGVAIL